MNWRWVLAGFLAAVVSAHAQRVAIDIDLAEQEAHLLVNGRAVETTSISSGRSKYSTPTGSYKVTEKDIDHRSSLYGKIVDADGDTIVADADSSMSVPRGGKFVRAPMRYFMRFKGGYGMHAGYLPGYAASHGCVRLPEGKARRFYDAARVGTPITIYGRAPRGRWGVPEDKVRRAIPVRRGERR